MVFFRFAIVVFMGINSGTRSRVEYLSLLEPLLLPLLASEEESKIAYQDGLKVSLSSA